MQASGLPLNFLHSLLSFRTSFLLCYDTRSRNRYYFDYELVRRLGKRHSDCRFLTSCFSYRQNCLIEHALSLGKKDRFSCVHRTLRQSPIFTVSFLRALYLSYKPPPWLGVRCGHGVCSLFGRLVRWYLLGARRQLELFK